MTADSLLIRDWYRSVKSECTCPIREREGKLAVKGQVEFHHIWPVTKKDHLSNIVFKNLMHPDSYCAVRVAVEFAKCLPICPDHHKRIHKGELPNLLADPYYQQKHADFHSQMIEMMPARFYNKVMGAMIMQPVVV